MAIWTIARKEARLLLRDPRAGIILIAMPFIFILVLGLSLGEGFGKKPDDTLHISVVDLDEGYTEPAATVREATARLAWLPQPGPAQSAFPPTALSAATLTAAQRLTRFPQQTWAREVQRDLSESNIKVEVITTVEEAQKLVKAGKRAAILVFGPDFSKQVHQSSFLAQGINPFYREGVKLSELGVEVLRDDTQKTAASIIEQVAQVSLLRVVLPWMIGRAFEKLSEPAFMSMLAEEVPGGKFLPANIKASLGSGVQGALKRLFPKYNLTGKTWAALTKSQQTKEGGAETTVFKGEGFGLLGRGEVRYQILVPSYTVTFAFFLVLTVGWLFVSERRQGTLKRLRAAPLTRVEILLGKLLPCLVFSLAQGLFLLGAGKLVFGMKWGPDDWSLARQIVWLLPVVFSTSLAAMGLAMLIASLARTETQVAIYGTPLVLILAGVSGCLMPRDLMPELMQQISLATPHAWALKAYSQLLLSKDPNVGTVMVASCVLLGFGVGFIALAWRLLKLD